MIVPDLNLLLYAYDSESPFHERAVTWWQECMLGDEPVLLPEVVAMGFVRVSTNARAYRKPMSAKEAASHVRSWLQQPVVQMAEPGSDHVQRVLGLLEDLGTAGNLVTDAQIAAITMGYDAVLHTADADFMRFKNLRWHNPILGTSSVSHRRRRS
jgi:uncharacterized protein